MKRVITIVTSFGLLLLLAVSASNVFLIFDKDVQSDTTAITSPSICQFYHPRLRGAFDYSCDWFVYENEELTSNLESFRVNLSSRTASPDKYGDWPSVATVSLLKVDGDIARQWLEQNLLSQTEITMETPGFENFGALGHDMFGFEFGAVILESNNNVFLITLNNFDDDHLDNLRQVIESFELSQSGEL